MSFPEAALMLGAAFFCWMGETANGTEDIWWILEGKDYPRLWWELDERNLALITATAPGEIGP